MEMTDEQITNLVDMGVAIDPTTGEFDLSILPIKEQNQIKKMAKSMIAKQPFKQVKKKKHKVKIKKTFGQNKKKKKK